MRLIERLNQGLKHNRKLTLISAPAGFGKTTLIAAWLAGSSQPVAWLSLDEEDNEPTRFLTYFVAALQTVAPTIGDGIFGALQSPQPVPLETLLPALANQIAGISENVILVLDDYHAIDAQAIDRALEFLVAHLPPQLHLVIVTRQDPALPLARYRARDQLTELRTADLRFNPAEAADFLSQVMDLKLSEAEIAALENRTEGWIAGLQLAALALRGIRVEGDDAASAAFIRSFSGSHRFVLDYLMQEVLQQQPEHIQAFLLQTSILNRLCGPLCEAVLRIPAGSAQATLAYLEQANLFIVPLDDERRWYRYHRLFADLLRQRLQQMDAHSAATQVAGSAELHRRASQWYETHAHLLAAFRHAAAANDIERAERLIGDKGMPLHSRAALTTILEWLAVLPEAVLDARPSLRVSSATLALVAGQTTGVEERLQSAEAALPAADLDDLTRRHLTGKIAAARATLGLTRYQPQTIMDQARRALEYLPANDMQFRFTALWTLAFAYRLRGDRAAAIQTYTEALVISQASGDSFSTILATDSLGQVQELENQLHRAAESYRHVLQLTGDHPHPNAGETHLGLARIYYEWNDLVAAAQHGQQSLQLVRLYDRVIDRFVLTELFLVRLKLAQGDVAGAAAMVAQVEQAVHRRNFVHRLPEVATVHIDVLLRQGNLQAAAQLAAAYDLPLSRARVRLAAGNAAAAVALLEPLRQQMVARQWQDELLKVTVLQAVARYAHGEPEKAVALLADALALAEPGGFIRTFLDAGAPMAHLLSIAAAQGKSPHYTAALLDAFQAESLVVENESPLSQPLVDPLSQRELEILQLLAQGLSNREIGARLFLALNTVKGHNRRIFEKLQVHRRTEAVARARELGLL